MLYGSSVRKTRSVPALTAGKPKPEMDACLTYPNADDVGIGFDLAGVGARHDLWTHVSSMAGHIPIIAKQMMKMPGINKKIDHSWRRK